MTSEPPLPGQPFLGPVEWFRAWLVRFAMDVGGRTSWGGISVAAIILLGRRLVENRERIVRVVARILAGTFTQRRGTSAPRRSPGPRKPRPPEAIPQTFGWMDQILPKDAAAFRGSLLRLLQDPEVIALIRVAPTALGRPLRSLCWMFKLPPPPVLALPRKPKAPRPETPRAEPAPASSETAPQPPPTQPPPQSAKPRRAASAPRTPPTEARGPPHPA